MVGRKVTQCQKILAYMEREGSITPLDAMREFNCMRLASRITDLKRQGYIIRREMETSRNRDGEAVSYARYRLEQAQ